MKAVRITISLLVPALVALVLSGFALAHPVAAPLAQTATLLDEQVRNSLTDTTASYLASNGNSLEALDDIDVTGQIARVYVQGTMSSFSSRNFLGVTVRFVEHQADGTPGAVQAEYFVPVGDANLSYDASSGAYLDVTLPTPFDATGRHFLSVQPHVDGWNWYSAAAQRSPMYYRIFGGAWNAVASGGLNFQVYGSGSGGGLAVIDALSTTSTTRSGYFEVTGSSFGTDPGQLLIDGAPAHIADWATTKIVAYVPETTALGTVSVQVDNGNGLSNALSLDVSARPGADGRVLWRLRMGSPYSHSRPVVGADGTVYHVDLYNRLYAVAADGGLKWVAREAGTKGIAIDSNGVIYTADEGIGAKAFNPDGSVRWHFTDNSQRNVFNIQLGPDGNLFVTGLGVEELGTLSVYSLTTDGELRWNAGSYITARNCRPDYSEMEFGQVNGTDYLFTYSEHEIRSFRLSDGQPGNWFFYPGCGNPEISPVTGNIHASGYVYTLDGQEVANYAVSPADLDNSGNVFGLAGTITNVDLRAFDANGNNFVSRTYGFGSRIVSVSNTDARVLLSAEDASRRHYVVGVEPQGGAQQWTVEFPYEETQIFNTWTNRYGFENFMYTLPGFTPDGNTSYFATAVLDGGLISERSYLYAVTVANGDVTDPAPFAPANLAGITRSSSQIDLTWTDNADNETGYVLERALDRVTFAPLATLGANVTSFSDTGLAAGTEYSYRVYAVNGAGNSGYSNVATNLTETTAPTATPIPTSTPTQTPVPTATPIPTSTPTPEPPTSADPVLYLSSSSGGRLGSLRFADEDILLFDAATGAWSLYFDGSDVGLARNDVNAFQPLPDGDMLMSFNVPVTLPGAGTVDDSDIVRFSPSSLGASTSGTWTFYFDGSDVGLSTNAEDIDSISFTADGNLIISTLGNFRLPGLNGQDEDLIVFQGTLGTATSGTWSLYFDGTDVGLTNSSEDVWDAHVDDATGEIYLTTGGAFAVNGGTSGTGADIFVCAPQSLGNDTACTFSTYWRGADWGFGSEAIDSLAIEMQSAVAAQLLTFGEEAEAEIDWDDTLDDDVAEDATDDATDDDTNADDSFRVFVPMVNR